MTWRAGALLTCALLGCGEDAQREVSIPVRDACYEQSDRVLCDDGKALTCRGGTIAAQRDCKAESLTCLERLGCRPCAPLETVCKGSERYVCRSDASALDRVETCASPLLCSPLGCRDLCADAKADRTYIGCDYWPVFTTNRALAPEFRPAITVGNGNLVPAAIVVTKGGATIAEQTIAAGSASTIVLDFDDRLRSAEGSAIVANGAFHVRASAPVTVHQYNPLEFQIAADCASESPEERDDLCYSYTNDASLLLPSEALAREAGGEPVRYFAASRAPFLRFDEGAFRGLPGMLTVVGIDTGPVDVRIVSSAHTQASTTDARVRALAPGETLALTLAPGEVLQLLSAVPSLCPGMISQTDLPYCDPGAVYDLTGTEVIADGSVQVIAGHDCANVPFDRRACDHLEESMVPLRTWGTRALLTHPNVGGGAASLLRVISGADDNRVTFEPAIHEPVVLGRGEWLEVSALDPVLVAGSQRLTVAQYLIGQGRAGRYIGDPSLSIAVPPEQYRDAYTFVTPPSYPLTYVDIVAQTGDLVALDGVLVTGFTAVGTTGYAVATREIRDSQVVHDLRSRRGSGVGIVLYGLGSYTSYMLPGGFSLQPLAGPVQ